MGHDLAAAFPEARVVFERADSVLGTAFSQLCFGGPEETLTDTLNAQPAILAHSVAALRVVQAHVPNLAPTFVAGHSLGEYSALVAAGAVGLDDALLLVRERGRVMKAAGDRQPGAMAAVLGMDESQLEAVCRETGAQIANYNAPGQIVISGPRASIQRAMDLAKAKGAKRIVPLAVSIAAHSTCMESAAAEFRPAVASVPLWEPRLPVVSNVNARPLKSVQEIRTEMLAQLTSSVRWLESIRYMIAQGVTHFVELGPKDVLAGLCRRIDKSVHAVSIGDPAGLKAFADFWVEGN
jgi:[acyl-carrier-protein] S-malonyltransferase